MDPARKGLFDNLEATGKLDPVRAQLRAILFQSLHGNNVNDNTNQTSASASASASVVQQQAAQQQFPAESLMIHELIRDYLQWAGMNNSLSVFTAESKMPAAPVPRKILASESGVPAAPSDLPLLFSMLHECKSREF